MSEHITRVRARNISLSFPIFNSGATTLRTELVKLVTGGKIDRHAKTVMVHALNNVSFEVASKERVALIGRNGAGKTTLLRVLGGIYAPGTGTVEIQGSVSCLLSSGIGMEPDATGYENICLAGMMMGMTRKETEEIVADVEEFCELGGFLDLPIRTYSAGMGLRLSFALATSIRPDILLVDEMIGVGDRSFYSKAEARLTRLLESSQVLVMASHDFQIIRRFCNKALLLDKGEMITYGPVDEVIERYDELLQIGRGTTQEHHAAQ